MRKTETTEYPSPKPERRMQPDTSSFTSCDKRFVTAGWLTDGWRSGVRLREFMGREHHDALARLLTQPRRSTARDERDSCPAQASHLLLRLFFAAQGETRADKERLVDGWASDLCLNDAGRRQSGLLGKRLTDVDFDLIYSSDLKRADTTCRLIVAQSRDTRSTRVCARPGSPMVSAPTCQRPGGELSDAVPHRRIRWDVNLREMAQGKLELQPIKSAPKSSRHEASSSNERSSSPPTRTKSSKYPIETPADVAARAKAFMSSLLVEVDRTTVFQEMRHSLARTTSVDPPRPFDVLIVTHNGFLQQLYREAFHVTDLPFKFSTGSLSRVDVYFMIHEVQVGRLKVHSRDFDYHCKLLNCTEHLQRTWHPPEPKQLDAELPASTEAEPSLQPSTEVLDAESSVQQSHDVVENDSMQVG